MAVYSVDKLIAQARKLASEYRKTTGKVLPGVSNEIAEHDAARLLNLELCEDRSNGFDAIGKGERDGLKIQIKARTIFDESKSGQRIGQINADKDWDLIVLVLMDAEYEPFEIYQGDRGDILGYVDEASANQRKRGPISVARFRIIGELVWTKERGAEDDIWSNQS